MKRLVALLTAVLMTTGTCSTSFGQSFAEIELSLGQLIDPTLKYLNCEHLSPLEEDLICKPVANMVKQSLADAGISILHQGVLYNQTGLVPNSTVGTCDHSIKVGESALDVLASRDSTFKFEINSLDTPLIFSARIPSTVTAAIQLRDSYGLNIPYPSVHCEWYGCWPTIEQYCVADNVITDSFSANAGMVSTASIAMAFSLEPRLLPRYSPYDDFKLEIAPRVVVDGSLDNIDLHFSISGRNDELNMLMGAVVLPGELTTVTADSFKLFSGDYNSLLNSLATLTYDAYVNPILSPALAAMNLDPVFTDQVLTELLSRKIRNAYSTGYKALEQGINSQIANALQLDSNGKRVFTILKTWDALSSLYDATSQLGKYICPYGGILSGTTCITTPITSVLPPSDTFGTVIVDTLSPTRTFTVNNLGSSDLVVSRIALDGVYSADFTLPSDTCSGHPVHPGGSCIFGVAFRPSSIGARTATLSVYSNDPANENAQVTLNGFGRLPVLSVAKVGMGNGSVTGSPAGISCGEACSGLYMTNSTVQLTSIQDQTSNFVGWSGGGCTGTGPCTVQMAGDIAVTANFEQCPGPKAKIGSNYYSSLLEAINAAADGNTILVQGVTLFEGASVAKSITIEGGYDCSFSTKVGETTLKGEVNVIGGVSTISDVHVSQ
jgi:hypothetical protein